MNSHMRYNDGMDTERLHIDHHIHIHHHGDNRDGDVWAALTKLVSQGAKIMATLDNLTAAVAKNKDVTDSAVALLQGLKQKLDEAIASGDPAKLQELADALGAETQTLADAVTANTPATP